MEDLGGRIKQISSELKEYIEARIELTAIQISEKVTRLIGQSIQKVVVNVIWLIGFVFGLVALSIYLGEILDEPWAGFAIIGGFFILIGLITTFIKPSFIGRRIQEQIIDEIFSSSEKPDVIKNLELPGKQTSKKSENSNG